MTQISTSSIYYLDFLNAVFADIIGINSGIYSVTAARNCRAVMLIGLELNLFSASFLLVFLQKLSAELHLVQPTLIKSELISVIIVIPPVAIGLFFTIFL